MQAIRGEDILKPRWDPALRSRALRAVCRGCLGALAGAAAGAAVARLGLRGHPVAVLLLVVVPLGLAALAAVAGGLIVLAGPIGRALRRFAAPVFWGAVIASVLLIWGVAELMGFVGELARVDPVPEAVTAFGGPLTTGELRESLRGPGRFVLLSGLLWPLQFGVVRDLVVVAGVVAFVSVFAMFAIWWERKVSARIQSRLGPMRVGGWHGWAQSLADGIKLLGKEDLIPAGADRPLFCLAPYLAFVPALCGFIALPFGAYWVFRNLDVGLVFVLAMVGVEVIGVILGGWASNNKWSLYGAMREACQMVSYEIPMGMALLVVVTAAGTLNLTEIGELQKSGWASWLAFRNPFTFVACFLYFVAALASCKRAPFDLPEAESELVAGFMTEYSGFRWCLFFFAEYAAMFIVSGLATTLFLGAWYSPLPVRWGAVLAEGGLLSRAVHGLVFCGPLWFVAKCILLIYVQMWIRWTLPRVRIDQVLYACVQVLLPLTMLALLGQSLWELLVPRGSALGLAANAITSAIGAVLVMGAVGAAAYGRMNRRRLVGSLAVEHLPGA